MNTAKEWAQNFPAHMRPMAESIISAAMQSQHQATWAMAIAAATGNCKVCVEKLPCPPLVTESK